MILEDNRILLLAEGTEGDEVLSYLNSQKSKPYIHVHTITADQHQEVTIREVLSLVKRHRIQELIFATAPSHFAIVSRILYGLYDLEIPIRISVKSLGADSKLRYSSDDRFVDLRHSNMTTFGYGIKWLIDKIAALLGLILLAPFLACIYWCVKRSSPGPVFYTQERIGLNGRPFKIYKFRSMYNDAESQGPQLCQMEDGRITPWGKTMRKYRLDELPQLWNVLVGDMSLVGPRPERAYFIDQLLKHEPQIYLLHTTRPGLTSWAMVNYGYASDVDQMLERIVYDWAYYEKMSLRFDIVVLFYTVRTVITGQGQ